MSDKRSHSGNISILEECNSTVTNCNIYPQKASHTIIVIMTLLGWLLFCPFLIAHTNSINSKTNKINKENEKSVNNQKYSSIFPAKSAEIIKLAQSEIKNANPADEKKMINISVPDIVPIWIDQKDFTIPFKVHFENAQDPPVKVELLYTCDFGKTWISYGQVNVDGAENEFVFRSQQDGEHWFVLRTFYKTGRQTVSVAQRVQIRGRSKQQNSSPNGSPNTSNNIIDGIKEPDLTKIAPKLDNSVQSSNQDTGKAVSSKTAIPIEKNDSEKSMEKKSIEKKSMEDNTSSVKNATPIPVTSLNGDVSSNKTVAKPLAPVNNQTNMIEKNGVVPVPAVKTEGMVSSNRQAFSVPISAPKPNTLTGNEIKSSSTETLPASTSTMTSNHNNTTVSVNKPPVANSDEKTASAEKIKKQIPPLASRSMPSKTEQNLAPASTTPDSTEESESRVQKLLQMAGQPSKLEKTASGLENSNAVKQSTRENIPEEMNYPGKIYTITLGQTSEGEPRINIRWFRPPDPGTENGKKDPNDSFRRTISIERSQSPNGPWTLLAGQLDLEQEGYWWKATSFDGIPFYLRTVYIDRYGKEWTDITPKPLQLASALHDLSPSPEFANLARENMTAEQQKTNPISETGNQPINMNSSSLENKSNGTKIQTWMPTNNNSNNTSTQNSNSSQIGTSTSDGAAFTNVGFEKQANSFANAGTNSTIMDNNSSNNNNNNIENYRPPVNSDVSLRAKQTTQQTKVPVSPPTNPSEFALNPLFTRGFGVMFQAPQGEQTVQTNQGAVHNGNNGNENQQKRSIFMSPRTYRQSTPPQQSQNGYNNGGGDMSGMYGMSDMSGMMNSSGMPMTSGNGNPYNTGLANGQGMMPNSNEIIYLDQNGNRIANPFTNGNFTNGNFTSGGLPPAMTSTPIQDNGNMQSGMIPAGQMEGFPLQNGPNNYGQGISGQGMSSMMNTLPYSGSNSGPVIQFDSQNYGNSGNNGMGGYNLSMPQP